jgi:hypothetical protein
MKIALTQDRTIEHRTYVASQRLIVAEPLGHALVAAGHATALAEDAPGVFVEHMPGAPPAAD